MADDYYSAAVLLVSFLVETLQAVPWRDILWIANKSSRHPFVPCWLAGTFRIAVVVVCELGRGEKTK